jgi:hypothetical protein
VTGTYVTYLMQGQDANSQIAKQSVNDMLLAIQTEHPNAAVTKFSWSLPDVVGQVTYSMEYVY